MVLYVVVQKGFLGVLGGLHFGRIASPALCSFFTDALDFAVPELAELAERFVEEGVRSAELPGIVFRSGPTGRRAGLHGGPDVWEIVRDVEGARAAGAEDPIALVVRSTDLGEEQVRLALAYRDRFPTDVARRISAAVELERALVTAAG